MPAVMRPERAGAWSFASRMAHHLALSGAQRQRWRRAGLATLAMLIASAAALVAIGQWTDWDLVLADMAYDASANAFPLRHAWLTETFNHVMLKRLFSVLAGGVVLAVLWDLCAPRDWRWVRRFQLRVIALSALVVPGVISLLKQVSVSHCPWDLQRYGGAEPYLRLLDHVPAGIVAGNCMPGGHASSALWMVSFCVLFIPGRLRHCLAVLAATLSLGIGVGWLQQLRGAHFLTHTLWSAWIAVATVLTIAVCLDRWPTRTPQRN